MRAYLVDDEPLALARLHRMLEGRLEIVGEQSDPVLAAAEIDELAPDVLFLDIEMPEWSGFKLLESLKRQPLVVFTTAYNQYALQAFEVNSIDYLLKPVEPQKLDRALAKLERLSAGAGPRPDLQALLRQIAASLPSATLAYPDRLASKVGDKVEFIELARVTHIFAKEKLTFAATPKKNYAVDQTIAELESKLDPRKFVRIHRSTIVNIQYVHELYNFFAGRMILRLKDEANTELSVARDRVKALKDALQI